ncbi:MAG: 2-oxo acid dehydrogenase subunit E2 [Armatimonadetes bacterium]|nr:2-oxo acid dehydrogenase subunit E2 [Armatimonadota bacterium]
MPRREEKFEAVEFTRVRQNIVRHTLASVNEVPQFPITTLVDMEPLIALRERLKGSGAERVPTYNDLMIKAVGLALREHRRFCAWVSDDEVKILESINVGFAVGSEQGVLMPTVREADRKSLADIAAETAELVELARTGKLRASLQMGAGFSISNLGPIGIDSFAPIVSPPQAGILGVGSIMPHAMVVDGEVAARRSVYLTLVMDHRSSDGADGAAFMVTLRDILTEPTRLEE